MAIEIGFLLSDAKYKNKFKSNEKPERIFDAFSLLFSFYFANVKRDCKSHLSLRYPVRVRVCGYVVVHD